ncbi:minor capsid protein [Jatrophihabitans sp.]|uniref:minor capsid protein n=1 Tax=Jatrophihabitans sp. TaxID=1932789 RepID=UPI0030C7288E|nr:hypothetical protein [Jatrophihabitans sp.]
MTSPTAAFLRLFVEGFAQALADAGIGLTWRPSEPYETGELGIGVMTFPTGLNKAVALTPYPLSDDPALSDSQIGLQVKTRSESAEPRDVWDLDDAIANVLLGLYPTTLPSGIEIVTLQRTSSTSLGQDESQRWIWSSNYPCGLYRPSVHRV